MLDNTRKNFSLKKCLICDGDEFSYLLSSEDKYSNEKKKYHILSCKGCGYSFTYLQPNTDLTSFYPNDYRQFKKGISSFQKKIYQIYYGLFFPLKLFPKGAEVLDLGSGNGILSFFLKNKGYKVTCVEKNETSANYAKIFFDLEVLNCELQDAGFPDSSFDIVILRHSLEHIDGIQSIMKEMRKILKKDGQIFLEVPNINSLESKIFQSNFYHLDMPRHIHHFNVDTLKRLFDKFDFKLKYLGSDNYMPHSFSMSIIYFIEKLIQTRFPCIIRKVIILTLYPLSLVFGLIVSSLGNGSIIRLLASKENKKK
jgi:2-polyprenyl-3-methyl-5-hydroxy-6-metoxy-1,4-benzoquinol methylase